MQLEYFADKFMINSDIKLFLMGLGHTTFDDLNEKELRAWFEYSGMLGYKVPVWGKVQAKAYSESQWLELKQKLQLLPSPHDGSVLN